MVLLQRKISSMQAPDIQGLHVALAVLLDGERRGEGDGHGCKHGGKTVFPPPLHFMTLFCMARKLTEATRAHLFSDS